jgi:hypothetical protein
MYDSFLGRLLCLFVEALLLCLAACNHISCRWPPSLTEALPPLPPPHGSLTGPASTGQLPVLKDLQRVVDELALGVMPDQVGPPGGGGALG